MRSTKDHQEPPLTSTGIEEPQKDTKQRAAPLCLNDSSLCCLLGPHKGRGTLLFAQEVV